ncbi:AsmA family protein [Pseudahrensia aquimaris]|uniref:AsmA family protein n=1 Tax=Pseudahrensia aquimaris TaxID=744461 RepID=A0ABW3FHM2_9HYPH
MRLFVFFGGLLVLALCAALIVPPFVDWNQFRDRFEREASRIVGQPVEVLGQTSARLLPLPSVTFEKIRVGDAEKPILAAEFFHINMELAPLLKGDVVIVDMALAAPRLDLRIGEDGKVDWSARSLELPADFRAADVALNNFTITDGAVRLRDTINQREMIVRDIDLEGSARSLAGPWRAEGFVSRTGERYQVAGTTGLWTAADAENKTGQLRVKLEVRPQNLAYDFDLNGPVIFRKGAPQFSGNFRVRPAAVQNDTARIAFDRGKAPKPINGVLEGQVKIGVRGVVVPEYKLNIGDAEDPYVISGTAFANFDDEASFEINADGQQVNFARLEADADSVANPPKTLQDRLELLRVLLLQMPRFTSPGKINLTLPAVVAGDTVVRDVVVEASPLKGGDGWALASLKAELPGRTDLLARGDLGLRDAMTFDGSLVLASRQPSGFAGWFVDDVPLEIRRLRNAGFSGNVKLGAGVAEARDVELVLNNELLRGSLERVVGDTPLLKAKLTGDTIDLDALRALVNLLGGDDIARRDPLEFDISTKKLIAFGLEAQAVFAKGILGPDSLALETASIGSLDGAAVVLTGNIRKGDAGFTGNLGGTVQAVDLRDLLKRLEERLEGRIGSLSRFSHFLDDARLTQDADLTFALTAAAEQSALSLEGSVGGSVVGFEGIIDGEGAWLGRRNSLLLEATNPRSDVLLAQLGLPVLPLDTSSAGNITLSAKGTLDEGLDTLTSFDIAGVVGAMQGNLKPQLSGDQMGLSGALDVDIRSTDLDTLITLTGLPLPGFGQGLAGEMRAALTLSPRKLTADRLTILHGSTDLRGRLEASLAKGLRPRLNGQLSTERLDGDTILAIAFGLPEGDGRLLSGWDGEIALSAGTVTAPNGGLLALRQVSTLAKVSDGDIAFEDVKASVFGGQATGRVALGTAGEAKVLSGRLTLSDADLARLLVALGYDFGGEGVVEATFNFDASSDKQASIIEALTGGGEVSIAPLRIVGLNADILPKLLAANDAANSKAGSELTGVSGEQIVEAGLFNGATGFLNMDIPFSVSSGFVRANDVAFGNDKINGTMDLRILLADLETDFNARIAFDAGQEAVVGAAPQLSVLLQGKPGELQRSVDTTPMETFLAQRSAEERERDFVRQQAAILERQRLSRESRAIVLARQARERAQRLREEEAAAQRAAEEQRRLREALPAPTPVPERESNSDDVLQDLTRKVRESLSGEGVVPAAGTPRQWIPSVSD